MDDRTRAAELADIAGYTSNRIFDGVRSAQHLADRMKRGDGR